MPPSFSDHAVTMFSVTRELLSVDAARGAARLCAPAARQTSPAAKALRRGVEGGGVVTIDFIEVTSKIAALWTIQHPV